MTCMENFDFIPRALNLLEIEKERVFIRYYLSFQIQSIRNIDDFRALKKLHGGSDDKPVTDWTFG